MPDTIELAKKIDEVSSQVTDFRKEFGGDIKELTLNVNRLVQIEAVRAERDHHFQSSHDDLKGRVDDHAHRITALEKISAGDEAIRRVFNGGITVIVGILIVGAIWAWATK